MRGAIAIFHEALTSVSAILLGGFGGMGANDLYFYFFASKIAGVIGRISACLWIPVLISVLTSSIAAMLIGGRTPLRARIQRHWFVPMLGAGLSYWLTVLMNMAADFVNP